MAVTGFDAARDCSPVVDRIRAAGLGFVCRYYSHSRWKNLSRAEAVALSQAGLRLVALWEAAGNRYDAFDFRQGNADARAALALAKACGQPEGSAIYFAVDFDATPGQLAAGIADYFSGVTATIGTTYKVGAYGSGMVCRHLLDRGLAAYAWLACAPGWQGTGEFAGWHIRQHPPADPWGFGFEVDPDEAGGGEFGQWSPAAIAALPASNDEATAQDPHLEGAAARSGLSLRRGDRGPAVRALQRALDQQVRPVDVDGRFGPATEGAVIAFQRQAGLDPDGIAGPATLKALGLG